MHILLSNSQAEPGTTVKQEQEDISSNNVQAFVTGSVFFVISIMDNLVLFKKLTRVCKFDRNIELVFLGWLTIIEISNQ